MPRTAQTASYVAEAERYAREVIKGKVPACRWTRLACERQLRDRQEFRGARAEYFYDEDAANTTCQILEQFPHIKGVWARAGNKLLLSPWQTFITCVVFGWKRRDSGGRRFRIAYIEVPRKNGKSSWTSAIGLYLLACDGEEGAYVVSAASVRHQALLVFGDAQIMARRETDFLSEFGVTVHSHAITQLSTASKFEAIAAEDSNLDGKNIHGALIDELHAHRSRGVWDVLETATGSRTQSLIWAITTAGVNRASVCYDQRSHVIQILERQVIDESYFGVIYTIDDGDDPFAESSWIKANPNYGVSVFPQTLKETAARAEVMASMQTAFLTKHLNVWVNADSAWLPHGAWDKLADRTLELGNFEGKRCWVGVDLALRSDITAVMLLFSPDKDCEFWTVFGRYFLPEDTINRPENSHYQGWERLGLLTETDGAVTDFDLVLDAIDAMAGRFDIAEVAYDPWKSTPLIAAMQRRGVTAPIIEVRQSAANFSPTMAELEALVRGGKIRHNGDPVLSWMFANVVCHRSGRQDLMQPSKESEEKKIDGVTGLLMCLNRAIKRGEVPDFEEHGLWSV